MEMNKGTESQIRELQIMEQTIQSVMMQKQAFQMELSEIENALEELAKSEGDVFKITGNVMIKSSKDKIITDLKKKKDLMSLRLKSLESQEKSITENSEDIRKKVLSKIK